MLVRSQFRSSFFNKENLSIRSAILVQYILADPVICGPSQSILLFIVGELVGAVSVILFHFEYFLFLFC